MDSGARDPGGVNGLQIVDRREVGRREIVAAAGRVLRAGAAANELRFPPEVAERGETGDHAGECDRHRGIRRIPHVQFAAPTITVKVRRERVVDLSERAAESQRAPPGRYCIDMQSLGRKPLLQPVQLRGRKPESTRKAPRRQPTMKIPLSAPMLIAQQGVETGPLRGRGFQY
jgi:hypothetical protein